MGRDGVADATAVFIEREVSPVVESVFDTPVTADQLAQSVFIGFGGQQAGNAVDDLLALGPV